MAVLISYFPIDRTISEKICDRLKARGVQALTRSRDIPPGGACQSRMVDAIDDAQLSVPVFYSNANQCPETATELSLAGRKLIIPARIEDLGPEGSFRHQQSNRQCIDLFADFDRRLDALCDRIRQQIDHGAETHPPALNGQRQPMHSPAKKRGKPGTERESKRLNALQAPVAARRVRNPLGREDVNALLRTMDAQESQASVPLASR